MRPARRDEEPTFGSIWQWGNLPFSISYVVLRLRERPDRFLMVEGIQLQSHKPLAVEADMTWGHRTAEGTVFVTDGWMCVDENGP